MTAEEINKKTITDRMDRMVRIGILSNNGDNYWVSKGFEDILKRCVVTDMKIYHSTFEDAFGKAKILALMYYTEPMKIEDASQMVIVIDALFFDVAVAKFKKAVLEVV